MVKVVVRLEYLLSGVAFVATFTFIHTLAWGWFVLLILTPDLSMVGYLLNNRTGVITYNTVHNYLLVLGLCLLGIYYRNFILVDLGIILGTHISFDRLFGFGLKYPTAFKDTHMQRI